MSSRLLNAPAPPRRCAPALGPLLLAVALCGCHRGQERSALSYEGSSTFGRYALPDLIAGYERASGDRFGAVSTHGSTAGFRAVMEGRAAVGGVARPLKSGERVNEPYYAIVGYDALAIFVNAANPLTGLSRAQLKDVFSGKAKSWKELGGPDAPIELVYLRLDVDHGSSDMFQEEILEGRRYAAGTEYATGEECVADVARRPNAVTFTSALRAVPGVKMLAVDGQAPEPSNVRSGEYLLSRPLLLLTKEAPRGRAKAFLDYVRSPEGQRLIGRHFVPAQGGT